MIIPHNLPKPVEFNEGMAKLMNSPATESPIAHIIPVKDDWFVIYKPGFSDRSDFDASEKAEYTCIYNVIAFAALESGKIVPLICNDGDKRVYAPSSQNEYELYNCTNHRAKMDYAYGNDTLKLYKED